MRLVSNLLAFLFLAISRRKMSIIKCVCHFHFPTLSHAICFFFFIQEHFVPVNLMDGAVLLIHPLGKWQNPPVHLSLNLIPQVGKDFDNDHDAI